MSLTLAVDTTHSIGSLYIESASVSEFVSWESQKSHAEVIFLQLETLLSKNNFKIQDISQLIVNHGPGSFTGIRIAINLIKTLSYALPLPVFCYNTLDIVAHSLSSHQRPLLIAINAHSNLCYFKNYESFDLDSDIQTLELEELNKIMNTNSFVLAGDYFHLMQSQLSLSQQKLLNLEHGQSDAKKLFEFHQQHPAPALSWKDVLPFYVRKSSPEEKLEKNNSKKL